MDPTIERVCITCTTTHAHKCSWIFHNQTLAQHVPTTPAAQVLVDPTTGRVRITSVGLVDAVAGDPSLAAERAEDGGYQAHRADMTVCVKSDTSLLLFLVTLI